MEEMRCDDDRLNIYCVSWTKVLNLIGFGILFFFMSVFAKKIDSLNIQRTSLSDFFNVHECLVLKENLHIIVFELMRSVKSTIL